MWAALRPKERRDAGSTDYHCSEGRFSLGPIDNVERLSAPKQFGFEIRCVQFPVGRLANTKSRFLSQLAKRIVSRERPTDALVHHGEAVVRECWIIHRIIPGKGEASVWILP